MSVFVAEWKELQASKVPYLLNLAQCELKLGELYACIEHCGEVLAIDPDNVKALFRRGRARATVWEVDGARQDLERAAQLDSGVRNDVRRELALFDARLREKNAEEAKTLRGRLFAPQSNASVTNNANYI